MGGFEDYKERHAFGSIQTCIREINKLVGLLLYSKGDRDYFDSIIALSPEAAKNMILKDSFEIQSLSEEQIVLLEKVKTDLEGLEVTLNDNLNKDNLFSSNANLEEYRITIKRGRRKKDIIDDDNEDIFDFLPGTFTRFSITPGYALQGSSCAGIGFKSPFFQLKERITCLGSICTEIKEKNVDNTKLLFSVCETLKESKIIMDKYFASKSQEIISKKLSKALKELNVTQAELAYALGVSRQTAHAWCNGIMYPTLDKLLACANYLNVSVDYLIRPDIEMKQGVTAQSLLDNYGISENSADGLHSIKYDNQRMELLNTMLLNSRFHSFCENDEIDILFALSKYFNADSKSYLITESDISDIEQVISNTDNLQADMQDIVDKIKQRKKNDLVALEELEIVLLKFKEQYYKEKI